MVPGPVGRLEALLNVGAPGARFAALICHPHPLHGGTMHNKVVYHAMKALTGFGFPALRFNFRGAGLSEGVHDQGHGEQEDVRAALGFLYDETQLPILFAGFSFGAATGLRVAVRDERVKGCISLGTPVNVEGRHYTYAFLKECTKPLLMISGGNDIYSPRAELQQAFSYAAGPKRLRIVEGADHFFLGKLGEMQKAIEDWVRETFRIAPVEEM
ncbi:MAG: alpha/beta hydrolase [Acidobacteriales bacterium]|nr:alpha/beta hydrolase [Terriglobales bacterium]